MLLEIKAVLFRADDPFTLTSGMKSPVYIDCRKIIAFPRMRAQMMDYGRTVIMNDISYEALMRWRRRAPGIPFAAWLAERTGLPMHYVRKKPKGLAATPASRATSGTASRCFLSRTGHRWRQQAELCRGDPYRRRDRPHLRDLLLRHLQGYA